MSSSKETKSESDLQSVKRKLESNDKSFPSANTEEKPKTKSKIAHQKY